MWCSALTHKVQSFNLPSAGAVGGPPTTLIPSRPEQATASGSSRGGLPWRLPWGLPWRLSWGLPWSCCGVILSLPLAAGMAAARHGDCRGACRRAWRGCGAVVCPWVNAMSFHDMPWHAVDCHENYGGLSWHSGYGTGVACICTAAAACSGLP